MLRQLFACCICVLALAQSGKGQTSEDRTLKGIQEFFIMIEDLPGDAASAGLTKADLEREVEFKLSLAGVKISDNYRAVIIYVNLAILKVDDYEYTYSLDVAIRQDAILSISGEKAINITTWSRSSLGYAGSRGIKDAILRSLKEKLDTFLLAYVTVNPSRLAFSETPLSTRLVSRRRVRGPKSPGSNATTA